MIIFQRATLGGSLALANSLKDFPSDIFLLFDAIGATITLGNSFMFKRMISVSVAQLTRDYGRIKNLK